MAILAACGSKSEPTATQTIPSNTGAIPTAGGWQQHGRAFLMKFADAAGASGGDCDKLATALEAIEADAKRLHEELVAAHKTLDDLPRDPALEARMKSPKDPNLIDRCENQNPRVGKALDATILTVVPSVLDDPLNAKRD
jgi:hypothetical protein